MAADLIGFSVFQLMQVKLGEVEGAASQVVMIMTAIAYLPGVGIALAGTTLVGQSIGAGDRNWALVLGNRVILLASVYMGGVGLLLAACGPWLLPLFVTAPGRGLGGGHRARRAAAVDRGRLPVLRRLEPVERLVPARRRRCDGARGHGASRCRGWCSCRWRTCSVSRPGRAGCDFLPNGAMAPRGGWFSVVIYAMLVGLALLARWRSRAWQRLPM